MNKESIIVKIEKLEIRLRHLLVDHKELKDELKKAREENMNLKEIVEKQNEDLKNFQNQVKISRIVSSMTESTRNSAELKNKINEYIREIDKCIAHLSE